MARAWSPFGRGFGSTPTSFGAARINNPSTTNQLCFDLQSRTVLTIKARYFPSTRTARTRSLRPLFLPNGGLFWLSWSTPQYAFFFRQLAVTNAGQRRSSKEPRQNFLSRILSSRTLVTRLGARLFWSNTKPQLLSAISRFPSALWRTAGATWPGKIADAGSKGCAAIVRNAEETGQHVPFPVERM